MYLRILSCGLIALCIVVLCVSEGWAQYTPRVRPTPRAFRAPSSPPVRGVRGRPITKPHANLQRRSTISPYLNLLRDDSNDALPNYFSLVRPMLDQQTFNQRQRRDMSRINRQVQQIQAQGVFPSTGDIQLRPTGHPVRFMNYSHFYSR